MNHPDDGLLQSFVDGELTEAEREAVEGHVDACTSCANRRLGLQRQRRLVSRALGLLDEADVPVHEARAAVLARAGAPGAVSLPTSGRRPWWRSDLARAAGLVLALAGVASAAIPGSPVRRWLLPERTTPEVAPPPESLAPAAPEIEAEAEPQETGIELHTPEGRLRVSITGLAPGGQVEVILVDGDRSGVYAPTGASFTTTPGGVEARVDGPYVRVELARSLQDAEVEVGGALYLRKSGDRLELPGPGRDSAQARFRFEVPGARRGA